MCLWTEVIQDVLQCKSQSQNFGQFKASTTAWSEEGKVKRYRFTNFDKAGLRSGQDIVLQTIVVSILRPPSVPRTNSRLPAPIIASMTAASAIKSEGIPVVSHFQLPDYSTLPSITTPTSMDDGQNTNSQTDEDKLIARPRAAESTTSPTTPTRVDIRPAPLPISTQNLSTLSHHRKNAYSIDSIPRQTIMKALVSRPPATSNLSISSTIQSLLANNGNPSNSRSRRLSESEAFSELDQNSATREKLAALRSPCFFHKRFDDVVDIEKVLSELQDDAYLSHSRMMQTATGVREVSRQLARRPIKRAVRNVMVCKHPLPCSTWRPAHSPCRLLPKLEIISL